MNNTLRSRCVTLAALSYFLLVGLATASEYTGTNCAEIAPSKEVLDPQLLDDMVFPQRDVCYFHQAVATRDVAICDKIVDYGANEICINRLAQLVRDYKFCQRHKAREYRRKTELRERKQHCLNEYAVTTGSPEVCKLLHKNEVIQCLKAIKSGGGQPSSQ
jgi:hypothetical protein